MRFEKCKINIDNRIFHILRVIFDDKAMLKTLEQSYLKSKYTRNENQNGDNRDKSKKFDKQIEGILGEIAVLEFVKLIFQKDKVGCKVEINRYDDVREDGFKSPNNEYDIKISRNDRIYYIEVRSSINYKYQLNSATLKNLDTIGTYKSTIKQNESSSDFYIRPLFQLKSPNIHIDINQISIINYLLDDKIELYITGGCDKKTMFGKFSKIKSMGQSKTKFQTLSIINGWDMKELSENLREIICNDN